MASTRRRVLPAYNEYRDFSGGLNIRDAPTELAPNETPACSNVTLDERGGLAVRLGITKLNGSSLLPAAPGYLYYSAVADAVLAYISSTGGAGKLYKSTDGGVTWSAAYSLFTTGAQGWIVDFKDRVVVGNTIDGVYSFPSGLGAPTHTAGGTNAMETVLGACGAVWQNKVWVGGLSGSTRSRVMMCAAGDELTWNAGAGVSNFVDVRDVDDQTVTAIGAGQGFDTAGHPALVVFKRNSTYRIYDSATGAYQTLHRNAGAAGSQAIAANRGWICSINDEGIWRTDGTTIPVKVSDKLAPLFTPDGLAYSTMTGWTAAPLRDRIVFNVARNGASTNNLQLEYHPDVGWIVPHAGMALSRMAVYTKNTRKLFAAHVSSGAVYQVAAGGSDDGTAISATWQSRWEPLNGGAQARLRRLRMWRRGGFTAYIKTDFARGTGDEFTIAAPAGSTSLWGTFVWGTDSWSDASYEGVEEIYLDEVAEYAALGISASVSSSASAPPLLGDGVAAEIGSVAFYAMRLDYIPLGAT